MSIVSPELRSIYGYAPSPQDEYRILTPKGKEVWRGSEPSCWQYLHRNCAGSILAAFADGYRMLPV